MAETTSRAQHRPLALDSDEEYAIIRLIEAGHANENVVTHKDVLDLSKLNSGRV
jgi:hypothetical protein